jgi:ribosomal protein L15E
MPHTLTREPSVTPIKLPRYVILRLEGNKFRVYATGPTRREAWDMFYERVPIHAKDRPTRLVKARRLGYVCKPLKLTVVR